MKIFNTTKKTTIATKALVADTALSRLKGLLGRDALSDGEALVITNCQSIHMCFMKFAIDVIFIDAENKVVGLVHEIKPFQFSPIFWKASRSIELPPQTIRKSQTGIGDVIQMIEIPQ